MCVGSVKAVPRLSQNGCPGVKCICFLKFSVSSVWSVLAWESRTGGGEGIRIKGKFRTGEGRLKRDPTLLLLRNFLHLTISSLSHMRVILALLLSLLLLVTVSSTQLNKVPDKTTSIYGRQCCLLRPYGSKLDFPSNDLPVFLGVLGG